jgi:hypothetical protein
MKKVLQKINNSKGYISIETIIVAGLVLGFGIVTINAYQSSSVNVSSKSLNNIKTANNSYSVTHVVAP